MAIHAIVRTDLLDGTDVRSQLVSVKFGTVSGTAFTAAAIDNGNVVKLDGLMSGEREVYTGVTPAASTDINDIVLIASVEELYDERMRNLTDFENGAGNICRGYRLNHGNIFSVTKTALVGATTPAVGDIVELTADTKLNVVAAATGATSGSTVVGEIYNIETVGKYTYYAIKVD